MGDQKGPSAHRSLHQEAQLPPSHRWDLDTPTELYPVASRGAPPGAGVEVPRRKLTRRRVRRTPVTLGVTMVLVGCVVILGVYEVNAQPRTAFLPQGNVWTISPTTLTGLSAAIRWWGGYNSSQVVVTFHTPDCIVPSGVVALASGAAGAFSAQLDPGTTYFLYACLGKGPQAMNFSVSLRGGLTISEVVAGFIVGTGAGLLAIGLRGRVVEYQRRA